MAKEFDPKDSGVVSEAEFTAATHNAGGFEYPKTASDFSASAGHALEQGIRAIGVERNEHKEDLANSAAASLFDTAELLLKIGSNN